MCKKKIEQEKTTVCAKDTGKNVKKMFLTMTVFLLVSY